MTPKTHPSDTETCSRFACTCKAMSTIKTMEIAVLPSLATRNSYSTRNRGEIWP